MLSVADLHTTPREESGVDGEKKHNAQNNYNFMNRSKRRKNKFIARLVDTRWVRRSRFTTLITRNCFFLSLLFWLLRKFEDGARDFHEDEGEHKGMFRVNLNSQRFDRLASTHELLHRESESRTKCVHNINSKTSSVG